MQHMTFLARLHIAAPHSNHIELDVRPSDCLNICMRAGVPVFVRGKLAKQMATYQPKPQVSLFQRQNIVETCMAEWRRHQDPFLIQRLQLQLCISSDQFEIAERFVPVPRLQ